MVRLLGIVGPLPGDGLDVTPWDWECRDGVGRDELCRRALDAGEHPTRHWVLLVGGKDEVINAIEKEINHLLEGKDTFVHRVGHMIVHGVPPVSFMGRVVRSIKIAADHAVGYCGDQDHQDLVVVFREAELVRFLGAGRTGKDPARVHRVERGTLLAAAVQPGVPGALGEKVVNAAGQISALRRLFG